MQFVRDVSNAHKKSSVLSVGPQPQCDGSFWAIVPSIDSTLKHRSLQSETPKK